MQSYLLQPNDIKKITGQTFYTRGKQYFERGKVYGLSHNSAIRSWRAVVAGTHDYEVRVFFFEDEDVEATCECAAYSTYYTCKHIAAVLIAIRERTLEDLAPKLAEKGRKSQTSVNSQDRMFAVSLFEAFRQRQENRGAQDLKKPLQIQYYLHLQSILGSKSLGIELKLGEDYPYVIKNIRDLLDYIRKEQSYRITKKFTYDPSEHTFSELDKKILRLLQRAYEQEQFYEQQWNSAEPKVLKVSPALVTQLLPLLEEQQAEVIDRGENMGVIRFEEFPHLSFYVSEERGHFHMHMNHLKDYDYLADYHLLYKQGTFHPIEPDKEEVMRTLYTILPYNSNGNHTVSQNDMEGIVSYVLPELETIAHIQLDRSAQEKIIQEPLVAETYLNFNHWTLTVEVKFHYGDLTIDPFNEQPLSNQTIVRRDRQTEQQIMQVIEAAEFKFDGEMVYIEDEDQLDLFLYQYLPKLKEYSEVYLSSSVRSLLEDSHHELQTSVQLESDGGWLDINFTIDGISDHDVTEALKAVIERKKYYRLSDGALMALTSDSFERFQKLVDDLDLNTKDLEESHIQVSTARSLQVEDALQPEEAERNQLFQELVDRLKSPQSFEIEPPAALQADLRPYQLTGFRWMKMLSHYGLGGVLADDMGLGKTIQTITYLLDEKVKGSMTNPAMIITPASLVYNWKKELEKFAPQLSVQILTGDPAARKKALAEAPEKDIWITSYPLLRQDISAYEDQKFHAMILDESQAIKNETTKTAVSVRSIQARHRFALSGTPIENSLQELWSLFRTIMPGFFTSKKKFFQLKPEKISLMTRPFILRRMKTEVLDELPDKIDTVQYSELTREQKEVYLAYLERIQDDIQETIATKGIQRGKLEILAGLTRLRQICCHPSLFLENYEGASGKLEQLKELTRELKDSGHRLLIFSQFSSMLTLMHDELTKEGLDSFYLDGRTKSEKRMEMVEAFNKGEKDAFFISLKAGGTGLNLTGADTVILYDLWWNPAIEEQAAGRAHRIGQEKVVQVIRMISEGTIEERIYQLQQKKRDLVDQIIQPGESMLTSLSEEEIKQLFN
ncbi:Superfamily II DNA or RNA helicase, SNF2 family [Halobacillus karajensis]|uniref:DEAD/DEAH box helicase n=1 Tax=Halobacillus karajensis TaxID=195088 RepID=UPI0008A778CE|nr:DEAD/DEAH box helicase [Halobacillus karajensis]SEH39698.1 Superfamily II DNA or RNA helicase, SNF2 family [Halobacillus karajensis]